MRERQTDPAKAVRPKQRRRTQAVQRRQPPDFAVVAIGASAGGLEACTKLLDALPAKGGMAFILVQHLDPTHQSMMVDLLAGHTKLVVREAADGMLLEREHLYVIPPGTYLDLVDGGLRLTPAQARRGARLPFDVLLRSLAREYGVRAVCVVLSGTGADGSLGLKAIKAQGGLVIAQEPGEAGYDGMPRSAIETGEVDLVLPVASIPEALGHRGTGKPAGRPAATPLAGLITLLRTQTGHDFTLYKPGTLQRRIERRMSMASIPAGDMGRYLAMLKENPAELGTLAKDLLINVTGFFRDARVFDAVAELIIPGLVGNPGPDHHLRVWIAGCSTGEEAYTLAMLFLEQIAAAGSPVKLQVFASDADAEAVATAREGFYPTAIETTISPARLARFFVKDQQGYRVTTELRAAVVFTVQDLLTDPPFSRLDLVSCRNLMIYLAPEAQRKIVALFHFALKPGGVLLLGSSEVVGDAGGRFEVISKPARLYRRIGRSRPGDVSFTRSGGELARLPGPEAGRPTSRQAALAELCRKHVLANHAPATVLSNRQHECLYSFGPIDRYLRVAPGHATLDLLSMVREDLRSKLRIAMQQAVQENAPALVSGGRSIHDGKPLTFNIEVQPVRHGEEELLLICFLEEPVQPEQGAAAPKGGAGVAALQRELETTRRELQAAISSLETSGDEQKAINEEALSVNEEFQSTNEELLTSKEELQSLNEELTALNSQLQETLEQQRTTSDDLQNVLYSTDMATLFLDPQLNIRFFTPATKALFNVIKSDVGRPLADLHSLARDGELAADACAVLQGQDSIEREIETEHGVWSRRVLPYRTHDNGVEGVVITFTDVTERRHAAKALEAAKHQAELANVAKSRFLAAASHDLRQPLQTLALLQDLLAKRVAGTASAELVARLDETLGAMSGMLNTLLDINQIEAGVVQAEITDVPIDDLLVRLRDEFAYQAEAQGLGLRVVRCGRLVRSDQRLLEQMIRNLVANALKYTKTGRVLLGCRRAGALLRIEVWDTGVGIPETELGSIFEEYRQLGNAARERSSGLGLGLSIVQRLGALLGHRVRVRSRRGRGSMFSIEVAVSPGKPAAAPGHRGVANGAVGRRTGSVLLVEDNHDVRELLELVLTEDGHRVLAAANGPAALGLVAQGGLRPDIVLTDYNLPGGMDGLAVTSGLREMLHREIPVIILTGDISTDTLSAIARQNCRQLNKPVKHAELSRVIQDLLAPLPKPGLRHPPAVAWPQGAKSAPIIFVVDDDSNVRGAIRAVLEEDGRTVRDYASGEAFLGDRRPGSDGCLLIDAYLPGMGGIELLQGLRAAGDQLPAIMITGNSDVPMAVEAMKAGAADFIEKPIGGPDLLASIERALGQSRDSSKMLAWREHATKNIAGLTSRQREIMLLVLAGHPSKNIAADLGVSQRTVENHRAAIMRKTGAKSLPALARLAVAASPVAE